MNRKKAYALTVRAQHRLWKQDIQYLNKGIRKAVKQGYTAIRVPCSELHIKIVEDHTVPYFAERGYTVSTIEIGSDKYLLIEWITDKDIPMLPMENLSQSKTTANTDENLQNIPLGGISFDQAVQNLCDAIAEIDPDDLQEIYNDDDDDDNDDDESEDFE